MLNFFQSSKQLSPERQYITHPSTTFPVPLYVILDLEFMKMHFVSEKYVISNV